MLKDVVVSVTYSYKKKTKRLFNGIWTLVGYLMLLEEQ